MALTVIIRPAISARSGLNRRSGRDGTITLCRNNERRNGEDVHKQDLGGQLKDVTSLIIQSQAQFSDSLTHKLVDQVEDSQMSISCRLSSRTCEEDHRILNLQPGESSSELICLDPVHCQLRPHVFLSKICHRGLNCFFCNSSGPTEPVILSRSFESKSHRFPQEFPSVGSHPGEERDKPCVPILTWPDPVHRCSVIPCPVCNRR
jgi:hypothetical protein